MESVKIKQEPQDPPDIFADVDMRGIPRREWLRQNIPNFPSAANVELGDIVTIKTEIKQEVVYFSPTVCCTCISVFLFVFHIELL